MSGKSNPYGLDPFSQWPQQTNLAMTISWRDASPSGREQRLAAHILAAAEQQCGPISVGVALDMANENDVVAAVMPVFVAALEMCGGADQHGRAAFRDHVVDLGKLVLV